MEMFMVKLRFTFGTVVKHMREQQGLSQRDLGVNITTVSQMELGNRNPKPESMKKIAQSLGTTVEAINAEVDRLNGLASGDSSGDVMGFGNNILGSNNIVGSNYGAVVARNGQDDARSVARHSQERSLSAEAAELLRIYESLGVKLRMKLLESAFALEEQQAKTGERKET